MSFALNSGFRQFPSQFIMNPGYSEFPSQFVRPLHKLLWLALDNNNIGPNIEPDTVLYNLGELQYLNLESNKLTNLPPNLLHHNVHKKLLGNVRKCLMLADMYCKSLSSQFVILASIIKYLILYFQMFDYPSIILHMFSLEHSTL